MTNISTNLTEEIVSTDVSDACHFGKVMASNKALLGMIVRNWDLHN